MKWLRSDVSRSWLVSIKTLACIFNLFIFNLKKKGKKAVKYIKLSADLCNKNVKM